MIAKLGSAARASGSLPSGSDFKVWRALGAQMGLGRCGLACCGDEARAQRKRPPRRNRAGALLESFHHTSSDCRRQESELCWRAVLAYLCRDVMLKDELVRPLDLLVPEPA